MLSWRIPTSGDPRLLRFGLAQVGLATIVAALALLVAAPREWVGWALAGLVPLAIFVAYRRWHKHQAALAGPDNVWLDEAGLHWFDGAQREQTLARKDITGYRIRRDEDTLRPVPALTLALAGGFESQPLELHPPASEEAVRRWLQQEWQLAEQPAADRRSHDRAIDVYSECHDDYQEWHWEGTREALTEFFAALDTAAAELPPPPAGARPAERIILASRREPQKLRIAHSPVPHFDEDLLAAPAERLHFIAGQAAQRLATAATPSDHKFDVPLAARDVWTFHLHVRS